MKWMEETGAKLIPANFGPMKGCNAQAQFTGPCGDTMAFWFLLEDRQILRASYTTDGCMTSIACGSVAAMLCQGRSLEEALAMKPAEILDQVGMVEADEESHCALLATLTIAKALKEYEQAFKQAHGECGGCSEECCEGCSGSEAKSGCPSYEAQTPSPEAAASGADRIKKRILVLSGKGGVGKSTVATHLAMAFASKGIASGLLDVDLHGPSIPKMLGLIGASLDTAGGQLIPVELGPLKIMSMGFALDADQAAIWRGPMKASVVDQFIRRTQWEDLDVLVVDCPPGTGDEVLSLAQGLGWVDGAIIVTTPQEVATLDAQKAITFCRALEIPVLGVVENMSGLACPSCGASIPVFSEHGGKHMATAFSVPFLGRIPLDPGVAQAGDQGKPGQALRSDSPSANAFREVFEKVSQALEGQPVG